ncbi:MAG: hypothetical protein U5K76_03525 [Woeseiaceae bacterium]|nr:hypothetical protein [Woeseiaceae bacterium]
MRRQRVIEGVVTAKSTERVDIRKLALVDVAAPEQLSIAIEELQQLDLDIA